MKKKIVSLLLAAVCFGSVFPGTVFAEEPAETETVYTLGEKELTVADVIAFSNMNRVLQWADFTDYSGEILHLKNKLWETEWQFAVADGEDGLMLRICGSTDKFPAHIYLSDSSKRQIDIRSDDVQSFLNKGAGEDSLTVSEEVKEHFRVYETYSDEFTEPERRLVQDFKSIMRYYNVPLRGAFTEFDNIDDVLASAYVLKKYYVVEYEDGSVKSYNEHFQEMKSNSYTIRNGEQVALPYLTIPENARNAFYNSDFVKTYIAPDAQVENVYWLSGESSMMGTAIYYRTSVGDYVYYYYHTIGETLFPVSDFCAYQQAIKDENAKYPESGGGINIADVWDLTDYRLKANISGIMGDVNNDGSFNISDVVLLQKWLLAVPDTYLSNWKAADFCDDDRLDVFDLTLMKRALIYGELVQSTSPTTQHIGLNHTNEVTELLNNYDLNDYDEIYRESLSKMFERFNKDGYIYTFAGSDSDGNAITLREDHPNAPIVLMPYMDYEDTGILYHVAYKGKYYQVYYYFTDPAYSASDLWDYLENQRMRYKNIRLVDEKYGIFDSSDDKQFDMCAFYEIDDTHYCKVRTYESEEALIDFLQVLSSEKTVF